MKSNLEHFHNKVNKKGSTQPHMDSPCWEWTGGKDRDGYGVVKAGGSRHKSHRLSIGLNLVGPWVSGICVLHLCDNKGCINPGHLYFGTNADNMRDMKMAFWILIAFILGHFMGWRYAHLTIADECKKLGKFYVGRTVYTCTAISPEDK